MGLGRIAGNLPGQKTEIESIEVQVWWAAVDAPGIWLQSSDMIIDKDTVDSGNVPTTDLRGGNMLAKLTATGKYTIYDPDANDGSQTPITVLEDSQNMLDNGVATDTFGPITVRAGGLLNDEIIGLDAHARAILKQNGVLWDDEAVNPAANGIRPLVNIADGTVAKTVVATENGTRFVANDDAAATTFTLPTIANGLSYDFLQTEDFNLIVTSAAGNDIMVIGDAAASTLTCSTATELIGSLLRLTASYVEISGTMTLRWITENLGGTTITPT